ncbi:hypothetical protein [Veillonella sp.]|uniref:hypothetical protein n=1 Tax=Veillonella sp. TaxID=1926307 RepID=UPI0025E838FF|nr:hypothetical protein [Veillonella sp.]
MKKGVIDVIVLFAMMLIAVYLGLVTSIIFRLNQNSVLEGRVYLAFLVPILHFIVCPIVIIAIKKISLYKKMRVIWMMMLLFPVVIAQFTLALSLLKEASEKSDTQVYHTLCENEFNNIAFA